MKKLLVILGIILFIPLCANAETLTYNICKSGCDYDDVEVLSEDINNVQNESDIIINFKDSNDYTNEGKRIALNNSKIKNIIINGNNATVYALLANIYSNIVINNLNICVISIYNVQLERMTSQEEFVDYYNNKLFLNSKVELNNIKFIDIDDLFGNGKLSSMLMVGFVEAKINNSIFSNNTFLWSGCSDVYFDNSQIKGSIGAGITGGGIYNSTNVYINPNNTLSSQFIRKKYYDINDSFVSDNYTSDWLAEFMFDDSMAQQMQELGITIDLNNNVYVLQETYKTIKTDTPISALSEGFVDTYKDSIGYDDIKFLPVEWKSQDETVAKVEGDSIKVIKPGSVDVVGTKGNDIYTIHLTVESSNSGTIEKKEQKENNYAEADFSSEDLNSIIPLTSEEQAIKDSGKNMEVFLKVEDISSSILSEDKKLVDSKLKKNEVLGAYLDVSLFKQVEGQEATKIGETNGNIKVSMKLPASLLNKDKSKLRTYYILRLHNGVVDKLETELNGDTLTFETNKFSTYALVYEDINNPQTGDNIIKCMGILFGSILLVVLMLVSKLRKE